VSSERGQSTVEWVGLVTLVALVLAFLVAIADIAGSGIALAATIKDKLICAVGLADDCRAGEPPLVSAYGTKLAAEVVDHAPRLVYEQGMRALPVDYRSCREDPCSLGPEEGQVDRSFTGEPVTLFVHALERGDSLYLQYWAYYPGSDTQVWGDRGHHPDDWESFQLRVDAAGTDARASSHQGYNYTGGPGNWLSDAGVTHREDVWGPDEGAYFVSGGSHAGHASDDGEPYRWTPASAVHLVPLEPIAESDPDVTFAITPPWLKRVWSDPEYGGTD
jgi:hypothetical protein